MIMSLPIKMVDHCPACGGFLTKPVLVIYGEIHVWEQYCKKCGAESDYVPGLFIETGCNNCRMQKTCPAKGEVCNDYVTKEEP